MLGVKHCPECRQGCINEIQIHHFKCDACGFEAKIVVLNNDT